MGGCEDVDEGLETSWWNFRVGVTHLSNKGVTCSDVDGGGKLWSFVNSDLVGCCGSCWIIQALLDGLTPLHPSNWGPQGRHGQEEVLGRKRSEEETSCGDAEVDAQKRQCEEGKNCRKGECPKVLIGENECDDEKVNEGDGGEVSGFEEQIYWPQHTLVVLEIVEMEQKEWNGGHEVVEVEMEGQQGPKLVVVLELEEEDETEQELIPVQVDFYISGLISLEEVQISLPYLLQIRKLEEAVELILRSSRFFTPHEWQKYVYSIRGEDSQEQARVEDFEVHNTPSAPAKCDSPKAIQRIPEDERADDCAATLRHFLEDPGKRTVVNWNTTKAKRRSHQADEGAGVQLCGDRPTFLAEQAPEPGDDGIRLISLDWHSECLGPLLAGAFVRCCQIHQAKSSGDREKA
eukprot:s95_g23.t1